VTDPFPADFGYQPPDVPAQVVLVSHEHRDHNATEVVQGQPTALRGAGPHEAAGQSFLGVASFHDNDGGQKRGPNTIFVWEMAGLKLVHVGDLGALLTPEQIAAIAPPVEVLMIPVGGYYTIDAAQAVQVAEQLQARVILPMHVKTAALSRLPVAPVDDFLKVLPQGWELQQPTATTLSLKRDDVPTAGHRVIALPYE
jgi:L-ascorbate metabolism protein UlaG (beta-lactamase superfamily)